MITLHITINLNVLNNSLSLYYNSIRMMDPVLIASIFLALLFLIGCILLYSQKKTTDEKYRLLEGNIGLLTTELQQEKETSTRLREEKHELDKELTQLSSDHRHLGLKYQELLEDQSSNLDRFEQLANRVLDAKTIRFDQQHKEGIKEILHPLKEKIQAFESKLQKTNESNIEKHTSLVSQLNLIRELNERITSEASNLTKALKGDNKIQGNWGELILESVLQKSGLEKDREYFVQETLKDDNGKSQRPDVIIALPDGKRMIIDSKVSLKAYESLTSAETIEDQKTAAKAHYLSVKTHVDGLSAKNYHALYQMESPDFVLMFIPIDTAFAAAVEHDNGIYSYAFEKNIVIVTPSTLLATLKTVDSLWQNDKNHRNALEVANEAGKMYDKFALLIQDLEGIGKRIDQTKDMYQESMKKLVYGKGNLMGRAEKVKALGAKTSKQLPSK